MYMVPHQSLTISSLLGIDKSGGGDGDEEEVEGQIARSSGVTTTTATCITSRAGLRREICQQ